MTITTYTWRVHGLRALVTAKTLVRLFVNVGVNFYIYQNYIMIWVLFTEIDLTSYFTYVTWFKIISIIIK